MSVIELKGAKIYVNDSIDELVKSLSEHFCEIYDKAVAERGRFTVALSGGTTPKSLYEMLATDAYRNRFDWNKVFFFWGDERCVPHTHPDSNYGMVKKALLDKIEIPAKNVVMTDGQENDPEGSAKRYEEKIYGTFGHYGDVPRFDICLLGLGPDGHTASLFPDSAALKQREHIFVANYVAKFQAWRLTATYTLINKSHNVIFLVAGDSKASIVKDIFQSETKKYPAQLVQPESGKLEWYTDRAAVAGLGGG